MDNDLAELCEVPYGRALGSYCGVESLSNFVLNSVSTRQNFYNGHYTGTAYDSVEFVRRWLVSVKGLTFHSVPSPAYFWNMAFLERIHDSKAIALIKHSNGTSIPIFSEALLVWKSIPSNDQGHIAIVTEVNLQEKYLRIVEQNFNNQIWPGNYSRELKIEIENNEFRINDPNLLGWVEIDFSENSSPIDLYINKPVSRLKKEYVGEKAQYLDLEVTCEKLFSDDSGIFPGKIGEDTIFYTFESYFYDQIRAAVIELNHMMLLVTDIVIQSDELLTKFGLPSWIWPKIRKSWEGPDLSGKKALSGRFDLAINNKTIKLIELNCDSAALIIESGLILKKKAIATGCDIGKDTCEPFETAFLDQARQIYHGFVHILIDNEYEEIYNAHYLHQIFLKIGLQSKIVIGLDFSKNEFGKFVDNEGREIKNIWKLWNWETVISDYEKPRNGNALKLSDILLDDEVLICEPIWKLVTSNKALLPILWEMWKGHPYLLATEWDAEGELANKAFVRKPIVGRCGQNVEIFSHDKEKLQDSNGNYSNRNFVYQEFFHIENFEGYIPLIGTWIIGKDKAEGIIIREDKSLITRNEISATVCRVIN